VQIDEPSAEYVPAAHCPEHVVTMSPVVAPKRPAGHSEQTAEDDVSFEVAPARAYDPIGQDTVPEQAAVARPVVEPNVPAAH